MERERRLHVAHALHRHGTVAALGAGGAAEDDAAVAGAIDALAEGPPFEFAMVAAVAANGCLYWLCVRACVRASRVCVRAAVRAAVRVCVRLFVVGLRACAGLSSSL